MKKAAVAIALLLASLALVACGGSDDSDSSDTGSETGAAKESGGETGSGSEDKSAGGGGALSFEADPSGALAFTTDNASWKAGNTTIKFTNSSSVPHNVEIEDESGKEVAETETITESSETTTADLKPGTYTFYCGVDGHQAAGMEGTLTVK